MLGLRKDYKEPTEHFQGYLHQFYKQPGVRSCERKKVHDFKGPNAESCEKLISCSVF